MTDARNVPRERVEHFIEEIHAAEGDYGIGLAITAMEAYMDAAPPARECAICHSIVDAYDARSELFTNDADCAGNLADKARAGLAAGAAPAAEPCYYCGRVHSEADPYCVKPAAEPAPDEYMCPNCVTPWKCNGPHIDRTLLRKDQEREDAK